MPNWCTNNITITGPKDKINKLIERARSANPKRPDEELGLLEAMVPIGDWEYGTAVETWGTKWDVSTEGLEVYNIIEDRAVIEGWFDSAWSPPVEAMRAYLAENPDVDIWMNYFEPGVSFIGEFEDGEESTYEIDPENLDNIPDDLREAFNLDEYYDEEDYA